MSRHRVLVIDSERNARHALKELLEEEGYEVVTSATGEKGLEKAEDFHPEVALVDTRDQHGVAKQLLSRGCAVILMSVFRGDAVAGLGFLHKPLNLRELFSAVAAASAPEHFAAARH